MQTIVRLIKHTTEHIPGAGSYEVRVSTFVYFDDNAGRRAVSGKPSSESAEQQAKMIARAENARVQGK